MTVYFVGAGPGDPELLTRKAHRLITECRVCVYAGSLVPDEITALIPEDAQRHDSARLDLPRIIEIMAEASARGLDVVRLHSGDPAIFGAIAEQMRELDQLGIEYEVVPGVSSFLAAAARLKTELTAPEISQTVILTRTEGRTPVPEGQDLDALARSRATMCVFLSAPKLAEICASLTAHYGADCPAAVVYKAGRPDELIIRGTLGDIGPKVQTAGIRKTAMCIVGRVLAGDAPASRLYDAGFSHEYRKAGEP
jgi:precorrin-4/cobalt-precorrin-4 C11-methyltransferase